MIIYWTDLSDKDNHFFMRIESDRPLMVAQTEEVGKLQIFLNGNTSLILYKAGAEQVFVEQTKILPIEERAE